MQMAQEGTNPLFEDATILVALHKVTNWFLLGIHLGVKHHTLKQIEVQHPRDIERCKLEMVACWRQSDPTASWLKLNQALRRRNYSIVKQPAETEGDDESTYYNTGHITTAQTQNDDEYINLIPIGPEQTTDDEVYEDVSSARHPSISSLDGRDEKVLNVPYCGKHKDLLQYFCSDPGCSQLLCCQCLATGKHSNHDWKELRQAFLSMDTRLEQAGRATQEAADNIRRQMDALHTEKGRVVSKCNTAKKHIKGKIGILVSQLNDRQAHLNYNLDHAKRSQSYLNHKQPQETLKSKMATLEELQKNGKVIVANLAAQELMSLGEVERARGQLEKVKSDVSNIQQYATTQHSSLLVSQFYADSRIVQNYLGNFGKVEVSKFLQVPHRRWSSYQSDEWKVPEQQRSTLGYSIPKGKGSASARSSPKKHPLENATSRIAVMNRALPPTPKEALPHRSTSVYQNQTRPLSPRRSTNTFKNRALPPVPQPHHTVNQMQLFPRPQMNMIKNRSAPEFKSAGQTTEQRPSAPFGSTNSLSNKVFVHVLPPFPHSLSTPNTPAAAAAQDDVFNEDSASPVVFSITGDPPQDNTNNFATFYIPPGTDDDYDVCSSSFPPYRFLRPATHTVSIAVTDHSEDRCKPLYCSPDDSYMYENP